MHHVLFVHYSAWKCDGRKTEDFQPCTINSESTKDKQKQRGRVCLYCSPVQSWATYTTRLWTADALATAFLKERSRIQSFCAKFSEKSFLIVTPSPTFLGSTEIFFSEDLINVALAKCALFPSSSQNDENILHLKLFSFRFMYKSVWYIGNSYRSICATIAGPYQSPAFFPALLPISTSWWIPNGADGWSPNQNTSLRCLGSACLSCADSGLFFWAHLVAWSLNKDLSGALGPRGEPKDGMGTPPARAGEWGLDTSKSTSVRGWASGQVQPARQKRPVT